MFGVFKVLYSNIPFSAEPVFVVQFHFRILCLYCDCCVLISEVSLERRFALANRIALKAENFNASHC